MNAQMKPWQEARFSIGGALAALPGLSRSTLNTWIRRGYVTPTGDALGSGQRRDWTAFDVVEASAILQLVKMRFPAGHAAPIARAVRGRAVALSEDDSLGEKDGGHFVFMLPADDDDPDGYWLEAAGHDMGVFALNSPHMTSVYAVLKSDALIQETVQRLGVWHRAREEKRKARRA